MGIKLGKLENMEIDLSFKSVPACLTKKKSKLGIHNLIDRLFPGFRELYFK